jgi:hypothetical protein
MHLNSCTTSLSRCGKLEFPWGRIVLLFYASETHNNDTADCCIEKGALHNTVYPELRDYCRSRGYELHNVDLHWKTGLEKQQDHEFPELCLGELTRK